VKEETMGVDGTIGRQSDAPSNDTGMNHLKQPIWFGRMSRGDHVQQARWRTRDCHPYRLGGLISLLDPGEIAEEDRRAPKDGRCFVPGVLSTLPSGEFALRQRDRVSEVNVLVADFDMGTQFASLQARLRAANVLALITPTYSHLRRSYAFRVAPARWQAYLAAFGSAEDAVLAHGACLFLPGIVEGGLAGPVSVTPVDPAKPEGALLVSFTWARPVPRWRVAVPLARGWIAEGGPSTATAEDWAKLYHQLTEALGLWDCDPSCSDASRLYFTARWPAAWPVTERDPSWKALTAEMAPGEPGPDQPLARIEGPIAELPALLARRDQLNWAGRIGKDEDQLRRAFEKAAHATRTQLPQITGSKGKRKAGAPRELTPWLVRHPETGEQVDLTAWHQKNGWGLDLATLIQNEHPELVAERGEGAGGNLHVLCPASDLHGTDREDGTFVWDGDGWSARGKEGARRGGMFCNHTACSSRSAGERLALLIDAEVLSWDVLEKVSAKVEAERLEAGRALLTPSDLQDTGPEEPDASERSPPAEGAAVAGDAAAAGKVEAAIQSYPLTEDGVGQVFAIKYADALRFCHGPDVWHIWNGARWRPDETQQTFDAIRLLARRMAGTVDKESVATTLGKAAFSTGVERFVRSHQAFAMIPEEWDRDPYLVGTPRGTLDLRSGELRPARRSDFITKLLAVVPAPGGTPAPLWDAFLQDATGGDEGLIQYIYRVTGYCLTGDARDEALFFLWGPGGSGKGTLLRTIGQIFGDYAKSSDIATFTETRNERHTQELARLAGSRLVTASEPEAGAKWKWARIKEITGHERPLTARKMYRDDVEFDITFKLLITGNNKPRLPATDAATVRRLNLIPFTRLPAKVDNTLKDRLVAEYPAILRRIIDGCLDWQRSGLNPPEAVHDATAGYLAEHGLRQRWIQEACVLDVEAAASTAELYASWSEYCRADRIPVESIRSFSFALEALGLGIRATKHVPRHNNSRGFLGIRLRKSTEAAEV
jgi:P4 family phage/plasmid primase-like protien